MGQPVFVFGETRLNLLAFKKVARRFLLLVLPCLAVENLLVYAFSAAPKIKLIADWILGLGFLSGCLVLLSNVVRRQRQRTNHIRTVNPSGISLYSGSGLLAMPGGYGERLRNLPIEAMHSFRRERDDGKDYKVYLHPLGQQPAYRWHFKMDRGEWQINDLDWQWAMSRSNWPADVEPKSVTAALNHCGIRPDAN